MRETIQLLPKSVQYVLTFLFLLVVAILHFINPPAIEIKTVFGIDKIIHLLIFFFVASWSCLVFSGKRIRQFGVFLITYGFCLELAQMMFVTGRYFEWMDWVFDVAGILLGLFAFSKRL